MDLKKQLENAELGNLVWSTVHLELHARLWREEDLGYQDIKRGLDLTYEELDTRERKYTSKAYGRKLGQLLRATNTDLFKNQNKGNETMTLAKLIRLNQEERPLIIELNKREQDYIG